MKFLAFCFICSFSHFLIAHRARRALLFPKNSKLFFRLNGKDNVIPWNQVFAHGWAFRVNYDLPEIKRKKKHKFFKRHTYQDEMYGKKKFNLISCALKDLCAYLQNAGLKAKESCKFFCQIGRIFNRSQSYVKDFVSSCNFYKETCGLF